MCYTVHLRSLAYEVATALKFCRNVIKYSRSCRPRALASTITVETTREGRSKLRTRFSQKSIQYKLPIYTRVQAAAPTSAPSLGRQLEAAPATVTSAAAPAVAWAGSQPSGPWSPWSRPGSHSNLFFSLAWQKISLAFSFARSDFSATGNRQKLC